MGVADRRPRAALNHSRSAEIRADEQSETRSLFCFRLG
jgi:hypothetical protein